MANIWDYLLHWRNDWRFDDINVMLDRHSVYLAANWAVESGVVDPDRCYPEFKEMETEILKVARKYRRMSSTERNRIHAETFRDCHTFACRRCNYVSFVIDGNEKLYAKELENCWECGSGDVERDLMYPTGGQ